MKTLTRKIQECTTISDIDRLGVKLRPTFRKTLETAIMLKNNADPVQRDHGQQFLNAVIREVEDDKAMQPATPHDDGIKSKGDNFVKEETLDNHNPETQDKGGEQSTDNVEPYPQVADNSEDGQKDMEKMDDTDNQMKEAFGQPPQPGMPQPGMPPMGLEPQVANEMGAGMPQLPPMNTNQMMRQMQYTINETLRKFVVPLRNELRVHRETIKKLSSQIREVEQGKGSMKLDIQTIKENATARSIRETAPSHGTVMTTPDGQIPLIHGKIQEVEEAKSDIISLEKMFRARA